MVVTPPLAIDISMRVPSWLKRGAKEMPSKRPIDSSRPVCRFAQEHARLAARIGHIEDLLDVGREARGEHDGGAVGQVYYGSRRPGP